MHRRHAIEAPAADARSRTSDSWSRRAAQLFGLVNVALAGPLLDLLAREPTFLVGHQLGRLDAVLICLALSVGMPTLLLTLERLAGRFSCSVHRVWIILLAAAIGSRIARAQGSSVAIALAILFGILAFGLLSRPNGRAFLTILGLLSVAIPIQFCLSGGIASLGSAPPLEVVPEITTPQSVIVIVFDELPLASLSRTNGSINETMYPNFASLAADTTWYPNAIAVAQSTKDAIPAMLTGRYPPDTSREPTVVDHPRNLFTLLSAAMPVQAIENASFLCPTRICPPYGGLERLLASSLWSDITIVLGHLVLPQVLVDRLPRVNHTWAGFAVARKERRNSANPQAQEIEDALVLLDRDAERANRGEHAGFSFLHLKVPHAPWQFLPSGLTYRQHSHLRFHNRPNTTNDPWVARQERQRHLLQVVYVDRVLGEMLSRLRRSGAYDQTLLIVTSDHGRAFLPNITARAISPDNAHAILPIPLFVKYPGQTEGRVDDRFAETTDITPTILDLLGVARAQWQTDGTSLRDALPPDRPTTTVYLRHDKDAQPLVHVADRRALVASRLEPAQRLRRDFGERVEDLFRVVPARTLRTYLGRPLSSLPAIDEQRRIRLAEPSKNLHIGPTDTQLPVYVAGTINPDPDDQRVHVAIAVDGIVCAITRTVVRKHGKRQPFQAILPPSCLTPGKHRIEAVALRHPP